MMKDLTRKNEIRIKRPFTVSAAALLFAYSAFMLDLEEVVLASVLISSICCTVFALKRHFYSKHCLLLCTFLVTASLLFNTVEGLTSPITKISGYDLSVSGEVCSYSSQISESVKRFVLKDISVGGYETDGKMYVYFEDNYIPEPGDRVSFNATALTSSVSNGIYRYHSLSNGIYLTATAYDGITVTKSEEKQDLYYKILSLKKNVSDKYYSNMTVENAAVTNALITGDKDGISNETLYNFKLSGVSHIFAVSGMHLSLWTGIFFIIFKSRAKTSVIPNLAAIIFVIFYCAFTAFSPSVLRAGIMLITVFAARIIRRHSDTLNAWGLAGTVLMTVNPYLAGNVSFLLSFIATFALIFFLQYIIPPVNFHGQRPDIIKRKILSSFNAVIMSLCVILTTLPITSVFFGYVPIFSPIVSLILTPIAEILMISSGIAAFIPDSNILASALFGITEFCSDAIRNITAFAAKIDFAVIPTEPEIILPITSGIAITVAFLTLKKKNKIIILKSILVGVLLLITVSSVNEFIHRDEISVYLPKSENSTMITVYAPGNNSLIYGTGGTFETARNTVTHLNRKGEFYTNFLFIPRSEESENCHTDSIVNSIYPENVINLYSIGEIKTYSQTLWNGAKIYSVVSDTFTSSVLYLGDIKVVICPLPSSDFSEADTVFSYGDILICREKIPNTLNSENFKNTLIITDTETIYPSDVITTADGDIEITIKDDTYAISR